MEASYRVGWRGFASAVLFAVGALNVIHGFAALDKQSYYTSGSTVTGSLHTWGWVLLVVGALQLLTAAGIFRGREWSISAGIILALSSFIMQGGLISVHPFGSLVVMALDVLVIYALMVRWDG